MPDPVTAPSLEALTALDEQLCFAIYAASHAFSQAYRPHLGPYGLSYPQYLVLLCLWERDDSSVKALGKRLHLDSGTLTPLLKRMEKAGWLTRRRDGNDERVVRISLTPKGQAFRDVAKAFPQAHGKTLALDGETAEALRTQLRQLTERLRAAI